MAQTQGNTMQLAEILSDLVSLRVCDPAAALALVSAHSNTSTSTSPPSSHDHAANTTTDPGSTTTMDDEQDPELKRAKDLLKFHYEVKEAHKRGELGRGLEEARSLVRKAVGG
ncbi:hypothetical protein BKA58DRAFT_104991 [Alternaria rosae]|uniref:uncharacterized protein n=1 Tax=Alternaria rosae TaxID=1187941 RepID=UPI001E8EA440|nr:uncharacterized protein BKA58DRAFT_104991 [Alternaria rosae]KAH6878883.1 hypothetical protein BKA58DRAFT_104991 [Alternaria rosae]